MDVFLSYARSSAKAHAAALRDALASDGVSVFFDQRDIPPGSPFPDDIADGLLASRLIVVFADATYFSRPWCVYEYRVALAPHRAAAHEAIEHMVIALPEPAGLAAVTAHLPPALASSSWPTADQTDALAALVKKRLPLISSTLADRVRDLDDEAVKSLRRGANVPAAARPPKTPAYLDAMPVTLRERFVGRDEVLWQIFHALETRRADGAPRICAIQGGAGMGKTQLAAEYVARYGPPYYSGGLVWINADTDKAGLDAQFRAVLKSFTVAAIPAGEIVDALQSVFAPLSESKSILWVIDNVPEPARGQPPRPLSTWCPVAPYVNLLCTSRGTGAKEAHEIIQLLELPLDAAVETLTQPPVQTEWLQREEWERIARWVGCWPQGLRILQTSLADGYGSAKDFLSKASGEEPAAALNDEVDALREEVPAGYLRGVAEAFHASYVNLSVDAQTSLTAHCIARLPRVAVPESLLALFGHQRNIGILAKRSWITPVDSDAGGRHWTMHRVAASYLRGVSTDPDGELSAINEWLLACSGAAEAEGFRYLLTRILNVVSPIAAAWDREHPNSKTGRTGRVTALALGTRSFRTEDRGERYVAGAYARMLGAADELVQRLETIYENADERTAAGIADAIKGMTYHDGAAHLMKRLLGDPRSIVRHVAFVSASSIERPDILAQLMLDMAFDDESPDFVSSADSALEFLLKLSAESIRSVLSYLADRFSRGTPPQRTLVVRLLGRLLMIHGENLIAGGWNSANIRGTLVNVALHDAVEEVAEEAAVAVSGSEHPDTEAAFTKALGAAPDFASWCRAANAMTGYARGLERPAMPSVRTETDDDGNIVLRFEGGGRQKIRPELLAPVAARAIEAAAPDEMRKIVMTSLRSQSGTIALADHVNALIDGGGYARAIEVANVAIERSPELSSAYWWRARALEGLGRADDAIADYGRVVELVPQFSDAWLRRGTLLHRRGDDARAVHDLDAFLDLEPNNIPARRNRAMLHYQLDEHGKAIEDLEILFASGENSADAHLIHASCLLNLTRYAEAEAAASRAIALDHESAEPWLIRGNARFELGRRDDAIADFDRAMALDPQDTRAAEWRAYAEKSK